MRIAALGGLVEVDAAGVGHAHRTCGLVKAFAGRVVAGAGEYLEAGVVLGKNDVAVPAGDHQAQKRRLELGINEVIRRDVGA